jgi:hypothetical protein
VTTFTDCLVILHYLSDLYYFLSYHTCVYRLHSTYTELTIFLYPYVLSVLQGSLMADIGSGDGKYFGVNPNIYSIGCDRSLKLLQVSEEMS